MYIYKTTNLINNKIYIGQSFFLVEESKGYLGSGTYLHRAFKKHGKSNFTKEIIESNIESKELLNEREIYYIAKYNSTNDTIGYNIALGGGGGDTLSNHPDRDTIIEKMKTSAKLVWEDPIHIAKMSKSKKLVWEDPEYRALKSKQSKEQWEDPEYRALMKEKQTKRWEDPNERAKHSEAQKLICADPTHKAKMKAAATKKQSCQKYRDNQSEQMSGRTWYHDPSTGKRKFSKVDLPAPWVKGFKLK